MEKLTSLQTLLLNWNDLEEIPTTLPLKLEYINIAGNKTDFSSISLIGTAKVQNRIQVPDNITDKVWLGSLISAKNKHYLKSKGITHILSILKESKPYHPEDFTYHCIPIEDMDGENIKSYFVEAIQFIDTCVNANGSVLVHCAAGVSRSATIVIAYVMKSQKLSFEEAIQLVQTRRTVICPNYGFRNQLIAFEEELKSENDIFNCNIS